MRKLGEHWRRLYVHGRPSLTREGPERASLRAWGHGHLHAVHQRRRREALAFTQGPRAPGIIAEKAVSILWGRAPARDPGCAWRRILHGDQTASPARAQGQTPWHSLYGEGSPTHVTGLRPQEELGPEVWIVIRPPDGERLRRARGTATACSQDEVPPGPCHPRPLGFRSPCRGPRTVPSPCPGRAGNFGIRRGAGWPGPGTHLTPLRRAPSHGPLCHRHLTAKEALKQKAMRTHGGVPATLALTGGPALLAVWTQGHISF